MNYQNVRVQITYNSTQSETFYCKPNKTIKKICSEFCSKYKINFNKI